MATEKQIAANRRNAQRSTGPTSEVGKSKVKFNALKHGMTAETAVLPYEDPNSYHELRGALLSHYQPVGAGEYMLVDLIVINYWRLLRARRVETATFGLIIETIKRRNGVDTRPGSNDDAVLATAFAQEDNAMRNINRYQTEIERAYLRAVDSLRKAQNTRLREERRNQPQPARPKRIGSVSQANSQQADPQPVTVMSPLQPLPAPPLPLFPLDILPISY